jgi:heptosyltransferase-2
VSAERILVVGPAWVGDMVMAQSMFMLLRERDPGCRIDVLAPAWSLPLLERMPEVEGTVAMPLGHGELRWPARYRLGRGLRGRYERAIVLPRSFKSALVPFHAGIPVRTGFVAEARRVLLTDRRRLDRGVLDQTVKRYAALGLPPGEPLPDPLPEPRLRPDPANQARLRERLGLDGSRPVAALLPGAEYGPAKRWPLESFGALAAMLAAAGWDCWVLGSARERADGATVVAASGDRALNLCGETSLTDAVDLLALARVAVTNDSGLMHVAAGVGTRVVAIYGSSSPRFTPPLTDRRDIVWLELDCSPCFERTCPLGHYRCLTAIEPARIAKLVAAACG